MLIPSSGIYLCLVKQFRSLLKLPGQVVVKLTPPGTVETDFAREMQDYIRANHKRFVKSGEKLHRERCRAWQDWDSESDDEAAQPRGKGTRDFLHDLTDFFALWNGAWWNHSCVIHHCAGPACCSSYEDTTPYARGSRKKQTYGDPWCQLYVRTHGPNLGHAWTGSSMHIWSLERWPFVFCSSE